MTVSLHLYKGLLGLIDGLYVVFVFCPVPEHFTHIGTSPLPVKGSNIWTFLGAYELRAILIYI